MFQPPPPAGPPPSLRVFVVENHPDTLKYLRMYLEQLGHSVRSALTLSEAVVELRAADYDVLISDIGLPDGDGWEILRRAQLNHPIYAVAMSGFGSKADRHRSHEAGFRHHILKPFVPNELDAMLDEAAHELALRH